MAQGIPWLHSTGVERYPVRNSESAFWDSKGPRLVPIGGIGINRAETNNGIMTQHSLLRLGF